MLSINVRKVVFSIIGIFVVSLIAEVALIFLVTSNPINAAFLQSNWFLIVDAVVVNAMGIIVGLIWEKSTRARYLAKVANNPIPPEHTKKIYKTVLIIAVVVGIFYILSNLWTVYELFALHIVFTIPPATYTGFYIGLVRYIILALVFIWLYSEPEPKDTSPILNIRQGLLLGIIYFFIMAIFSIFSLATFKVAAGTASIQVPGSAIPSPAVIDGQGQEVSLGEMYPSLSQFSVILPSGFKMVAYGGEQVVITPASSSQDLSTSTGAYSILVEPGAMSPREWADGEGPVIQQGVNSTVNYGGNMSIVTSTVLFGNSAEEIFSVAGEEAGAFISFEQNGSPFVLGIEEASNISDPSLSTVNKNLNSIWAALTFGGIATGNNPIPQSAILSTTTNTNSKQLCGVDPMDEGLSNCAAGYSCQFPSNHQKGAVDGACVLASSSAPVTAVQNNSNATIAILSPSGGDTWQMGQEQTIKWSSVGVGSVSIYIHFSNGIMCGVYRGGILPSSPGQYSFVLTPTCTNGPTTLTSGQYTINIADSDPGNDDPNAYSQPFNIISQ
jgi:predicted secreted protein